MQIFPHWYCVWIWISTRKKLTFLSEQESVLTSKVWYSVSKWNFYVAKVSLYLFCSVGWLVAGRPPSWPGRRLRGRSGCPLWWTPRAPGPSTDWWLRGGERRRPRRRRRSSRRRARRLEVTRGKQNQRRESRWSNKNGREDEKGGINRRAKKLKEEYTI